MLERPRLPSDESLFEALLADLAARFADVPAAATLAEVERALARLVDFYGYDRCTYSEVRADDRLHVVASAASPGIPALPPGEFGTELKWFAGEMRAGRMVALPDLPRGLPPQAGAEAEFCRRAGLRSHLAIPLRARGRVAAVVAFACMRAPQRWSADTITRLTIIGEILAGAMSRARSEEEAQALRLRVWHADRVARVSALTAAIAHEINQPLAAILSNAQAGLAYLARGAPAHELRPILDDIVRDDRRAAETIRTMRNFLRRDEGGRERIDLAAALHDVLGLLAAELVRQRIRIERELEPGCWVMADRAQLEQVVLNLVLNAAAAMERSGSDDRRLRISAARTADGRVAVEVSDNGAGIAAEHLDSVFDPFWTTRKDGLGLGLAICRSIIDAHGGTIRALANPPRGATFRFELALAAGTPSAQPVPVAAVPKEAPANAQEGQLAVCVVDDDAAVRDGLARLLAAEGRPVAGYASASDFLERQPLSEVGCILLDQNMPGMSGLELLQLLAARAGFPPVIFLTGHGELESGVQAMKAGALDYLPKPVEAGVLREAVSKALARREAERTEALRREHAMARLQRLSAREHEVMMHVVRGRLNKQIAADLEIAIQTVKQHRSRVMDKMEVDSVAELVKACDAAGALPADEGFPKGGSSTSSPPPSYRHESRA